MASAPLKTIRGRKYAFGPLPATKALALARILLRAFGEPMVKVFAAAKLDGKGASVEDIAVLAAAFATVTDRLAEDELQRAMELMFTAVSCDGRDIAKDGLDLAFNDRGLREMLEAFYEGMRVYFADFFPAGLSASSPGGAAASGASP